jgi:hypothetical protein
MAWANQNQVGEPVCKIRVEWERDAFFSIGKHLYDKSPTIGIFSFGYRQLFVVEL